MQNGSHSGEAYFLFVKIENSCSGWCAVLLQVAIQGSSVLSALIEASHVRHCSSLGCLKMDGQVA